MLNPFFLGGLACAILYHKNQGKTFSLNHHLNYRISSYLQTIHFPGCYEPTILQAQESIDNLNRYRLKSYIPLIAFPTGQLREHDSIRESVLSAITKILKAQLQFNGIQVQPLSYFIDEMTHNINDHSRADKGFIFAQNYPSSNYIDVCICDYGIGILESYHNNLRFTPANEIEAVEFAINGRSTKNRAEARGFGISTSRDMLVNGLRGKFFLWTCRTAYIQSVEKIGILNIPECHYFHGTLVALRIPTIIPLDFGFYKYV